MSKSKNSSSNGNPSDPPRMELNSRSISRVYSRIKEVNYSWKNVNVYYSSQDLRKRSLFRWKKYVTSDRHILKNVNGICQAGELLAIMGASGAGKTTLLNVLTHRNMKNLKIEGEFCINGRPMDSHKLTKFSGYVQQDDLFIESLTVQEQLVFQALLRMDRTVSHKNRLERVEEIILELGLTKCAYSYIGKSSSNTSISGGERRRLMFGCEVLTNPSLLFCDEPTSGLDSFMAQNVVAVMENMAEKGKTIISTIHQPSSEVFAMFDRVLLMSQGRVAFLGDADAAYEFFSKLSYRCPENYNPADHYIELLSIEPRKEDESFKRIKNIVSTYDSTSGIEILQIIEENEKNTFQPDPFETDEDFLSDSVYKNNYYTQMKVLVWRSWLEVSRSSALMKIRPIQLAAMGVVIGLLFGSQQKNDVGVWNLNGVIFLLLINMTFQNAATVVDAFCSKRGLLLREHHAGMYRIDVYFFAKTLVDFPVFLIFSTLYSSIIYYLVGLNPSWSAFFFCIGVVALVAQTAMSYGYMISCGAKDTNTALAILLPPIIPLMLTGGFFLNRRSVPVYLNWIQWLSWFNLGNEAILINQWKGLTNITCTGLKRCFEDGEAILQYYDYDQTDPMQDILVLLALCVLYRSLALLFLWLNVRKRNNKR